jgi:hypothetical protein
MLFRLPDGNLTDIRRSAYPSDSAYQMDIIRARGLPLAAKPRNIVEELRRAVLANDSCKR